jgi:hypothetical protein
LEVVVTLRILFSFAAFVCLTVPVFAVQQGGSTPAPTKDNSKPINIQEVISSKCGSAPLGLVELNGATATKDQMEDAKYQVVKFMTESDVYADCVAKASAAVENKLTDGDKLTIAKIGAALQNEKESVANSYNQAVDDFNTAHGVTPAPAKPKAAAKPKP